MCQKTLWKPLWALRQHKPRNMQWYWLSHPSSFPEAVVMPYSETDFCFWSHWRHQMTSVKAGGAHIANLRLGSRDSRLFLILHPHHLIPESIQMLSNINMDLFTILNSAEVSLSNTHLNSRRQAKCKWKLWEHCHQPSMVERKGSSDTLYGPDIK